MQDGILGVYCGYLQAIHPPTLDARGVEVHAFEAAQEKRLMKKTAATPTLTLFLIAAILGLFAMRVVCQTETLDIVTYTPPAGWAKTDKEGAVVYSDVNKATGGFCVLTIYSSTTSAGSADKDFANDWNNFVVKPFKADANPKTETQTNSDGWKGTVGSAPIETDGGLKGYAILTVFSGFGKTAAILVLLNDQSYAAVADALIAGVKLDKTQPLAKTTQPIKTDPVSDDQTDPFPDKPNTQPQKPLVGRLKNSITMDDLAGKWEEGGAVVTTTIDSGDTRHTDTSFVGIWYLIGRDGSVESHYQGRTSNQTVRGTSSGTITLSGGHIILTTTAGEGRGSRKYQFVSYMTLPNGGAVLTLIYVGDNPDYNATQLYYSCGHANGYIDCISGTTWVREPAK